MFYARVYPRWRLDVLWAECSRLVSALSGFRGQNSAGDKPGDIPVEQPTALELIINLKAAKSLGLVLSSTLIATADEVME
jgi:putative tryptophan/tyrosine transport system substrate-binding protein